MNNTKGKNLHRDFVVKDNNNNNTGWICPKCGVVHSPWVDSCECSRTRTYPPYYQPYYQPYWFPPIVWC